MLEKISEGLLTIISSSQNNFLFVFKVIGVLWLIQIINYLLGYRLNVFGIYPRTKRGLTGIIFSPFLHGDFNHLFFNSIPLFVLSCLILLNGKTAFYQTSLIIIILSGFLTWSFGRRAIHIGASNLIMGYFGYLLAASYFNFNATTIIVAIVCIYYFGGMLLSVFPSVTGKNVSWEGHIFGLISGVSLVFLSSYLN